MKIVISGGSGQVGTILARAFHGEGHEVVVLSRTPRPAPWKVVAWDGITIGSNCRATAPVATSDGASALQFKTDPEARTLSEDWTDEIDGADVVINLAGRSVDCRYHTQNRREILDSRVQSTRAVGAAISRALHPPKVWLQASTATIYAHRYDADNDEATGLLGSAEPNAPDTWRFSIEVAQAWEWEFDQALTPLTRKIKMRSAMTMSPDAGGVFATLSNLVRCGLGGAVGDGRQFVSWIHEEDFIRAVHWLIAHDDLTGPVNLAAPHPLPYSDFMHALRQAWSIPFGLPTPRWMLEIGTWLLRTESELVLKSRRVVPARLLSSGFTFRFPTWPEAARNLRRRTRDRRAALT